MYILITYDVDTVSEKGQKRLRQVAKACKDYGQRVQNSVFECDVTEAQFVLLKSRIEEIIDQKLDSIRFYFLKQSDQRRVLSLGRETAFDMSGELII